MVTTEHSDFLAESTITELLTDNKDLLDKQINKQIISNFIEQCKYQKKNERFLNLLSALCSCNGEAIASNQDDICAIMLENEENKTELLFQIRSKGPY